VEEVYIESLFNQSDCYCYGESVFFCVEQVFFFFGKGLPDVEEVSIESLFKVIAIDVPDAGSPAS
jgi:hypothetical protein